MESGAIPRTDQGFLANRKAHFKRCGKFDTILVGPAVAVGIDSDMHMASVGSVPS